MVVLVEGPSDVPVIEEFLIKDSNFDSYSIKFWPLGGDIMGRREIDLSVFAETKNVMALIDQDNGSKVARTRFKRKCREMGIYCHQLKNYAIENYFTVAALKNVFHSQLPVNFTEINPDIKLKKQIGIDVKDNNRKIAKTMSLNDINNTDLMQFFHDLKNKLQEIT